MKRSISVFTFIVIVLLTFAERSLFAQGFGHPLTIQGIDQFASQSVRSAAEGNIFVGVQGDISLMFQDPSALQSLKEIQVTLNGQQFSSSLNQNQEYSPLKYYSNFSLLMEGLTGYLSNPDTTKAGVKYANAGDTVQRPYDNIVPGWSHSSSRGRPIQGFMAVPFTMGEFKCAAGIGSVEYANLDWFFQNDNVLSPSILAVRQGTTNFPPNNDEANAIPVQWYLSSQSRLGTIYGYGAAFSMAVSGEFSLGVSGMLLDGSSDDFQTRVDRGKLIIYSSYFRLDSIYNRVGSVGSSKYRGAEFTLSGSYRSRHVIFGFSVKPPTVITRTFSAQVQTDTTGSSIAANVSGKDKTMIPWRGTVGLSFALRENLRLGLEYEIRPYASTKFTASDGSVTYPWLSSNLFHIGAEFTPLTWLAVRAGAREQAEVFQPEGSPFDGVPVGYSVYSFGIGFVHEATTINFTYEYSNMKYTDMWVNAVSINGDVRHTIMADISYQLPW